MADSVEITNAEIIPASEPPTSAAPVAPPPRKGHAVIAWLTVLIVIGVMMARNFLEFGPSETPQQDRLQGIVFDLQARALVGEANSFLPIHPSELYGQAKVLNHGSWEQRLKFIVLAGELAGPQEAEAKAVDLQRAMDNAKERPPTPQERQLASLLESLYSDYQQADRQSGALANEDRDLIREKLGWFGELALHPRDEPNDEPERDELLDPARTTFGTVLGAFLTGGFLSFVGFIGLVIFVILLCSGYLSGGLITGSNHGGVYAETFALYLCVFLGLSLALSVVPLPIPAMAKASLGIVASLLVLVWPVLRGIPWGVVRQEIGWTLGRAPSVEPALGIACYIMALPIVIVGLVLTLLLMALANRLEGFGLAQNQPVHPIIEYVVHGSNLDRFFVFFAACVLAPIVEETMFRGVLYCHLRELSGRWGWLASVIFSGTIASFVFAAIHPQGFVTIPVLMSLAYGFTIAREWRGSLIPSMCGHALNNGMVMLLLLLATGG